MSTTEQIRSVDFLCLDSLLFYSSVIFLYREIIAALKDLNKINIFSIRKYKSP